MKKIIKDALILFAITLIAGILLGFVFKITKDPIADQKEKTKLKAYSKVFETMDTYKDYDGELSDFDDVLDKNDLNQNTIDGVVYAYDTSKNMLGVIVTVTNPDGYGGNIQMTVGIDTEGKITGLEFLSISETAGLGMKAKNGSFKDQFIGKGSDVLTVIKTKNAEDKEIDAISGATFTSKAVTSGVNASLIVFGDLKEGGMIK